MKYAVATTALFLIIGGSQTVYLIKKKRIKEIVIGLIIMAIALIYSYSVSLHWDIPAPAQFISEAFKPVAKFVFGDFCKIEF